MLSKWDDIPPSSTPGPLVQSLERIYKRETHLPVSGMDVVSDWLRGLQIELSPHTETQVGQW